MIEPEQNSINLGSEEETPSNRKAHISTKGKIVNAVLAVATFLVLTPGSMAQVTQVEGSAGGGIVPWALPSQGKPTASFTWVNTGDYSLTSLAVQGSLAKRLELSYGRMSFDSAAVGLGKIDVDVFSGKFVLLKMEGRMPAVSVGVQYKKTNANDSFLDSVGADDNGVDFYVAATKVFKVGDKSLLLNGTVRGTKANQLGILGFGSETKDNYSAQFEGSVGVFLNDSTVLGVEYRAKPDNIAGLREQDWGDLFFAYFPNQNISLVAAYAQLGDIAAEANASNGGRGGEDQRGLYLQVQINF